MHDLSNDLSRGAAAPGRLPAHPDQAILDLAADYRRLEGIERQAFALEAADLKTGSQAADEATEARYQCGVAMAEARAATLDGLRARARIVAEMSGGEFVNATSLADSLSIELLRAIVRDLVAVTE